VLVGLLCFFGEAHVFFLECLRVPKPDQKRILETIVFVVAGCSRPRGFLRLVWVGGCTVAGSEEAAFVCLLLVS